MGFASGGHFMGLSGASRLRPILGANGLTRMLNEQKKDTIAAALPPAWGKAARRPKAGLARSPSHRAVSPKGAPTRFARAYPQSGITGTLQRGVRGRPECRECQEWGLLGPALAGSCRAALVTAPNAARATEACCKTSKGPTARTQGGQARPATIVYLQRAHPTAGVSWQRPQQPTSIRTFSADGAEAGLAPSRGPGWFGPDGQDWLPLSSTSAATIGKRRHGRWCFLTGAPGSSSVRWPKRMVISATRKDCKGGRPFFRVAANKESILGPAVAAATGR